MYIYRVFPNRRDGGSPLPPPAKNLLNPPPPPPAGSLYTQVMLILILNNAVFSFEKGLNGQIHFSSGSHHTLKKFYPSQQSF